MIYRKWSLLTGPPAILGAIFGTVIVTHFLFEKNDPFRTPGQKKQEPPSTK